MKCDNCGTWGDWIVDDSPWTSVHDGGATHSLYRCDRCGNEQWAR